MKKDTTRKAQYRHRVALAHAKHIESEPPQPPPWGDVDADHARSRVELAEYRARQRRWEDAHPGYLEGWARPDRETAEAAYNFLEGPLPVPLETIHRDPLTAKQLLVVALDTAVIAGRYGRRRRDTDKKPRLRQVRRRLTRTRFFDVIARYWSPTYRYIRDTERAYSVFQMSQPTILAVRRDLLCEGISVPRLWKLVAGSWSKSRTSGNPLFHVSRSKRLTEGYGVVLHRTRARRKFEKQVRQDQVYGPTRVPDVWRLWIDGTTRPQTEPRVSIVAEQRHSIVTTETQTETINQLQEQTRLVFDPVMFVAEYRAKRTELRKIGGRLNQYPKHTPRSKQSQEERDLRRAYHTTKAMLLEYRFVFEQARPLKAPVVIRSGFSKVLNRRFQPEHFWLMEASGKAWAERSVLREPIGYDQIDREEFAPIFDRHAPTTIKVTQRDSWFIAPSSPEPDEFTVDDLVHVDVSSSQTQLVAVFCGIEALEKVAVLDRVPLKETLAKSAWEHRRELLKEGYGEPDIQPGGRLLDACKNLWMRVGYGSPVQRVVLDQSRDTRTYGPGWTGGRPVTRWMATLPGFGAMSEFLELCRFIGANADPYDGVTLADPLDLAFYTWNPIARADVPMRFNRWAITAIAPGYYWDSRDNVCPRCQSLRTVERKGKTLEVRIGKTRQLDTWWCGHPLDKSRPCKHRWPARFEDAEARSGRWPVAQPKLKNMIAPCLVHSLDSLFAACVMQQLAARGVRDFASIHDCWYMRALIADAEGGSYGLDVLEQAVRAAGRPWLEALGPVYGSLENALLASAATMKPTTRARQRALDQNVAKYRASISAMRAKWEEKRAEKRWPEFFAVGESTLRWDRTIPYKGGGPDLLSDRTMP